MLYVWRNVLRTCRASAVSGCIRTMSSLAIEPAAAQLADGAGVAEASVIDESLFNKTLDLLALRVPAPLCSRIMAALRPTPFLFTHSRTPDCGRRPASSTAAGATAARTAATYNRVRVQGAVDPQPSLCCCLQH